MYFNRFHSGKKEACLNKNMNSHSNTTVIADIGIEQVKVIFQLNASIKEKGDIFPS